MKEEIKKAIESAYATIGLRGSSPPPGMDFPTGARLAFTLGYPEKMLMDISCKALDAFVGAAPLPRYVLGSGQRGLVVDCGAGSGLDALWLSMEGFPVVAIDSSREMVERLNRALVFMKPELKAPVMQVQASLPEIPLADSTASFVCFNGVANLVMEREILLSEALRILKPGGRLLIADILALEPVEEEIRTDPDAWAFCVGGAEEPETWERRLGEAGFSGFQCELIEEAPSLGRGVITALK